MAQVTNAIVDNTNAFCENCGLSRNHIADGAFQCFSQGAHEVTFRAHLYATFTSSPQELIYYIINWVRSGVSIPINGLLLTVDRSCDVAIESFSELECTKYQQHQTTELAVTAGVITTKDVTILKATTADNIDSITTQQYETTASKSEQPTGSLHFSAEVIVVGAVVVMVILIVAVMLTVVIVVCLCTKYHR